MYKELNESELKTGAQIEIEYPGKAYVMVNIQERRADGFLLEPAGNLYAIADNDGLEDLCAAANKLEAQGISILINILPLDMGKMYFIN